MAKSLVKNSIIYVVKNIVSTLLPLISFPYVTRTLSVETIGRVSFAGSIINYFLLFAGMGVFTYAIKEGAKLRDNKEAWNLFASEVFSFHVITTVLAYALFIIMLIINQKWHFYAKEMLIISLSILWTTLGVDWVFTIYEDYLYMAVRSLAVQVISIVFLLAFVKNDTDIYSYAFYTVFTTVGSYICNFVVANRHAKIKWHVSNRTKRFIRPCLIFFLSSVATEIYTNSDVTMLGYFSTDNEVGLYMAGVKIYSIAKMVLLSIGMVSLPRLSNYAAASKVKYDKTFIEIFNVINLIALPAAAGLSIVSPEIVRVFAGSQYSQASVVLAILAFALPFCCIASYLGSCHLATFGKEKGILFATTAATIVNMVLNFLFIPKYGAKVAACTTVLAEMISAAIQFAITKRGCPVRRIYTNLAQAVLATIVMAIGCILIKNIISHDLGTILLITLIGVCVYFICLFLLKNEICISVNRNLNRKKASREK